MKPYYEHGDITIYNDDCREVLPTLRAVDLVVSDPPFGIAYVSNRRAVKHKAIVGDDVAFPTDILSLLKLSDGAAVYMFCRETDIGAFNAAAFDLGLSVKRALVWDKGNWASGDLEGDWACQYETIAWASKGRHLLRGSRPSNLIRIAKVSSKDHPTEKPESLLAKIITVSSDAHKTVLDPFMGTGAALVAAKRLGRRAIGIEIDERYCEIAARRLSQEVMNFDEASA